MPVKLIPAERATDLNGAHSCRSVGAQQAASNSSIPLWLALGPGGVSGAVQTVETRGGEGRLDYFSRSLTAPRYACDV